MGISEGYTDDNSNIRRNAHEKWRKRSNRWY